MRIPGQRADGSAFEELVVVDGTARATVRRAHADELCAGHFPGEPLIPGAYLAGLMSEVAAALLADVSGPVSLTAIEECAFRRRVVPQQAIAIEARLAGEPADPLRVDVEVRCGGVRAARARLRFGVAA